MVSYFSTIGRRDQWAHWEKDTFYFDFYDTLRNELTSNTIQTTSRTIDVILISLKEWCMAAADVSNAIVHRASVDIFMRYVQPKTQHVLSNNTCKYLIDTSWRLTGNGTSLIFNQKWIAQLFLLNCFMFYGQTLKCQYFDTNVLKNTTTTKKDSKDCERYHWHFYLFSIQNCPAFILLLRFFHKDITKSGHNFAT